LASADQAPGQPLSLASPASDPPLRQVELPQGIVSYTDEGPADAPPLIAVHGVPGSVRDFRYLAPHLTDAVRLLRVNLPGFGGSPPSDAAVRTLAGRAEVVSALAALLGLPRYGVLGHSMGGGTAMVLAAGHPRRVSLLALVASLALSPHRGVLLPPHWFGLPGRALETRVGAAVLLPLFRALYRQRRFRGVDQMTAADFALQCRAITAADFALMRRAAAGPRPPTLVAYAQDDPLIQTWVSEELAAAMPDARVLAFAAGGHHLQKTRAAELARALREGLGVSTGAGAAS
jgi:pimeloyl-ACP methyl ester carboxylesterase